MKQLAHFRFGLGSQLWLGLLVCMMLVACQPIQPEPTTSAAPAATIPTPDLTEHEVERWSASSPDDAWQADGLVALPKPGADQYYTELHVRNADGTVLWTPVATWSHFGLGYTTPRPLHWSPDGAYLYFTNLPVGDGCALFVNASDLQRLDLSDGTVKEILPPNITLSMAFAPDGNTLAYADSEGVVLLDPTTTEYTILMPEMLTPDAQWGNFVWSPDSQQLVFTVANQPCGPDWPQSVILVDVQSQAVSVLVDQDPRRLTAIAWDEPDSVTLQDRDDDHWKLDLATGEITQ